MNKMRYQILITALIAVMVSFTTSCTKDLDTEPLDDDVVTPASIYETPQDFRQVLAKLYAGFAVTGQQGPAGNADIQGIDEGFSNYIRQYWVAQEIPTDEAVVAWADPGLPEFNYQNWNSSNDFVMALYSRIFYEIAMTNEFIREAQGRESQEIQTFKAEARFIRAYSYWHALDLYGGNVPFVTEDDDVGAFSPEQTNAQDLFAYIESELLDIEDNLPAPQANEYGRVDRAAVWALLARLYLNAEVYINEARYSDAITYAEKVINETGYSLETDYEDLFLADNNTANGIIWAVNFDGIHTKTYGGTNFIIHAAVGGDMSPANFGIDGGWGGHRVTPQFVDKFDANDGRGMFYTDGQSKDIPDIAEFTNGYAVTKWKNLTSDGQQGADPAFVDTDFPMFRLAEMHLIYAEAVLRGGGNTAAAVGYINDLRQRAFGDDSGNISESDLTLDFIIDERARELYWEGHRRTDLIRYNQYTTGDYTWAWKGQIQEGAATDTDYRLYPLPASDINANPNLQQNPGY